MATRWPTRHADKMLEVSQRIFGWLGWLGVLRALNLSRGISAGLPARQVAELGGVRPGEHKGDARHRLGFRHIGDAKARMRMG